ncbi:uncharacterized protein TNCV_4531221 [Trichonephila clavipes]|nr:uncharacterized protein TNCV_4531221 [Trichonephila clavipes]
MEVHEIPHGKCLSYTPVVIRSFEHHAGDTVIWLVSTPILRENTLEGRHCPSISLPLPPTIRGELRLDGYLEYPHAVKAWGYSKLHLQTSMPSPGFEPGS